MITSPGQVFAACQGSLLQVRVVGRGTSHGCPALRQFVEKCLAAGADTVLVHLAECSHLDSTFVGTLLFLTKRPSLKRLGGVQLIAPSPECRQVLKQMAVLSLFSIRDTDAEVPQAYWQEIAGDELPGDTRLFKQNVVEAHEELAAVPGPLSDCFRSIAETCRQELDAASEQNHEARQPAR